MAGQQKSNTNSSSNPCTLYKEAQGGEKDTRTDAQRDHAERLRESSRRKKAKPERETKRRRRSAEEGKAENKRRARQKVEPHSNFLFFFAAAFIFLYHSAGSPKATSSPLTRAMTPRDGSKALRQRRTYTPPKQNQVTFTLRGGEVT
ncbi:hypothetical protein ACLB2K_007011 [Fragaria x ananassa]